MINQFIDLFLHLDKHIGTVIQDYSSWTYLIVFLIIFCETGLVFLPFLPGDSLLFVLGAFSAAGSLELKWLLILLSVAATLGDTVNYWIGYLFASKIHRKEHLFFINEEHLARTQKFYDRYGVRTIIIARFVPIIRTVAPFLAGVGEMRYSVFLAYNVIGGLLWVFALTLGGYFFGNVPFIKEHLSAVVLGIIAISLIPVVKEFLEHRSASFAIKKEKS